jgi:hypothetical protein
MPRSFLLRFQEECLSETEAGGDSGTKTVTKVHHEGHDLDHTDVGVRHAVMMTTVTRIAREGTDKYETYSRMHAIDRRSAMPATKTMTEVKKESPDDDAGWSVSEAAIPRSRPARNASTRTVTAVRAEADDRDDDRHRPYHAITACS